MEDLARRLKALDAYPKVNEDFFTRTFSGGVITVLASLAMGLLFLSELRASGAPPAPPPAAGQSLRLRGSGGTTPGGEGRGGELTPGRSPQGSFSRSSGRRNSTWTRRWRSRCK